MGRESLQIMATPFSVDRMRDAKRKRTKALQSIVHGVDTERTDGSAYKEINNLSNGQSYTFKSASSCDEYESFDDAEFPEHEKPHEMKHSKQKNIDATSDGQRIRRSKREVAPRTTYSPPPPSSRKKRKKKGSEKGSSEDVDRVQKQLMGYCITHAGVTFSCDLCHSPYISNPGKTKIASGGKSHYRPRPRRKRHPRTGQILELCNACGLAWNRMFNSSAGERRQPTPPELLMEEKERFLKEAHEFGEEMVKLLNDSDAERLTCIHFKTKSCGCVQLYIRGEGDPELTKQRATLLFELLKKGKELTAEKCYNMDELNAKGSRKGIGLGNGHKKSQRFEQFVQKERMELRQVLSLCERATQRILSYSNNFLHKRLRTEQNKQRIVRTKGQATLGLLKSITELPLMTCCRDKCVLMSLTHTKLLEEWRERASMGQLDARRVIAEMLTPSGVRRNCEKFIGMVTGCSGNTIWKVNQQMVETKGMRDPPEHGLKRYWENHPRRRAHVEEAIRHEEQDEKKTKKSRQKNNVGDTSIVHATTTALSGDISTSHTVVEAGLEAMASGDGTDHGNLMLDAPSSIAAPPMTLQSLEAQRNAIMQVQRQLSQQREWLEQQIVQSSFLHDHTQVPVSQSEWTDSAPVDHLGHQFSMSLSQPTITSPQPLSANAMSDLHICTVTTAGCHNTLINTQPLLSMGGEDSMGMYSITKPLSPASTTNIIMKNCNDTNQLPTDLGCTIVDSSLVDSPSKLTSASSDKLSQYVTTLNIPEHSAVISAESFQTLSPVKLSQMSLTQLLRAGQNISPNIAGSMITDGECVNTDNNKRSSDETGDQVSLRLKQLDSCSVKHLGDTTSEMLLLLGEDNIPLLLMPDTSSRKSLRANQPVSNDSMENITTGSHTSVPMSTCVHDSVETITTDNIENHHISLPVSIDSTEVNTNVPVSSDSVEIITLDNTTHVSVPSGCGANRETGNHSNIPVSTDDILQAGSVEHVECITKQDNTNAYLSVCPENDATPLLLTDSIESIALENNISIESIATDNTSVKSCRPKTHHKKAPVPILPAPVKSAVCNQQEKSSLNIQKDASSKKTTSLLQTILQESGVSKDLWEFQKEHEAEFSQNAHSGVTHTTDTPSTR